MLSHCSKRLQLPSGQLHPFLVGSHLLLAADALVATATSSYTISVLALLETATNGYNCAAGNCTHFLVGSHLLLSVDALTATCRTLYSEGARSPPPSLSRT